MLFNYVRELPRPLVTGAPTGQGCAALCPWLPLTIRTPSSDANALRSHSQAWATTCASALAGIEPRAIARQGT